MSTGYFKAAAEGAARHTVRGEETGHYVTAEYMASQEFREDTAGFTMTDIIGVDSIFWKRLRHRCSAETP